MKLDATFEVLLRFKSKVKVGVTSVDEWTKDTLYLGNLRDSEYHFVRFEGAMPPIELDMSMLKGNPQGIFQKRSLDLEDWTITDFDDCLKGNPHLF